MTAISVESTMPNDVSIEVRNRTFELEKILATDWADNDPFLTAFFNAMSISFPAGERNFIDSVRAYEDRIADAKLAKDVADFYQQEAIHSREHRKYNKLLCQQRGYDLASLERVFLDRLETAKNDPQITPRINLAATVSSEHFTATFGENILEGRLIKSMPAAMAELWQWHSLEELEHKSVAFDVYNQIGGSYKMRTRVMRFAMFFLFKDTLSVAVKMLRHDKQLWKWKTFKSVAKFLFSKDGFIRAHVPAYKAFFQEDFHPWEIDNRSLLKTWQEKLQPTVAVS